MYDRIRHPFKTRDVKRILNTILERTCEQTSAEEFNDIRYVAQETANFLSVCGQPITSSVEQSAFVESIVREILDKADTTVDAIKAGTYSSVTAAMIGEGLLPELYTNIEENIFGGGAFGGAGATRET